MAPYVKRFLVLFVLLAVAYWMGDSSAPLLAKAIIAAISLTGSIIFLVVSDKSDDE